MNKEQLSRYLSEFIKSPGSGFPALNPVILKNRKDWHPAMLSAASSIPPRCAIIGLIGDREPSAFVLGMEPDDEYMDNDEKEGEPLPPQFVVHDHNNIVGYSRMVYVRHEARQWELLSIEQGNMAAEGEMFALPLRGY